MFGPIRPFEFMIKPVSGTYCSRIAFLPPFGSVLGLELRVDVDSTRPQNRISGDFFSTSVSRGRFYSRSFMVEVDPHNIDDGEDEMVITGSITYDSGPVGDTIEVRIPRVVGLHNPSPPATVTINKIGWPEETYLCEKASSYFREVELEIDKIEGTEFPDTVNSHTEPYPADLPRMDVDMRLVFQWAGVDMTVMEDDIDLGPDPDDTTDWTAAEMHDPMEAHFSEWNEAHQWNLYGLVVPRIEPPVRSFTVFGYMFDNNLPGDRYHRQGAAIAYDAIREFELNGLFDTDEKKDRFLLRTFAHELGHAFGLSHVWDRDTPDVSSLSIMNYPQRYRRGPDRIANTHAYYSDFRWQFDDVELMWIRHAYRHDIIFGGAPRRSGAYSGLEPGLIEAPFSFEVRIPNVIDFAVPVRVELKLKNCSRSSQRIINWLQPEDGLVTFFIQQPNGNVVQHRPPSMRINASTEAIELAPGDAIYESVLLTFGSKQYHFQEPGDYFIWALYYGPDGAVIHSNTRRLRVAHPMSRASEELAYLIFKPEVARILYYGGSARYPEIISKLHEAAEKYDQSDPVVVRHIYHALGRFHSRPFKHVVKRKGKRVVCAQEADLNVGKTNLQAAHELLSARETAAFDNITYNKLSLDLVDICLRVDDKPKAKEVLEQTLNYFKKNRVIQSVVDDYQRRLRTLKEV